MIINVSLSEGSLNDAIAEVRRFRENLNVNIRRLCERLAELGAAHMRETYAGAAYGGTNDVQVDYEWDGNAVMISAHGYAVGFIEFGTGVTYAFPAHGTANSIPAHGTFGKRKGATGKPWVYYGGVGQGNVAWEVHDKIGNVVPGIAMTRGNPAACAIPQAVTEMRNSLVDVAREVFG